VCHSSRDPSLEWELTKLDQFESFFKSAAKEGFAYARIDLSRVLLVSDLAAEATIPLLAQVRAFLSVLDGPATEWQQLAGGDFASVRELLDSIAERQPDLIVTWRHLHSSAWHWPYSLGEYLDVLTQATEVPVLVLPHPDADRALPHALENTDRVMAITDHLTGDARLVNHALRFTERGGTCWLTHIEGERQFERFLEAVSKIPEIDTADVRELVAERLLKEPRDYIRACRKELEPQRLDVKLEEIVRMGRRISEYESLVAENQIDLLVLNTMDGDQLAMHGQAYPLAVELRAIPLLML
jgi:hypothetical protein